MILVYTTYPSRKDAELFVKQLLDKKLIACANIFPIKSIYRWKHKMQEADEVAILLKSNEDLWNDLKGTIEEIHPYDVPCILKLDAKCNEQYQKWLNEELS